MNNLFLLVIFLNFSCNQDNDYLILNRFISETKNDKYNLIVNKSNNNSFLISKLKNLQQVNIVKTDSLKNMLEINNDSILNNIFSKNEYDYLISQKINSNWNFQNLSKLNKEKIERSKSNKLINNISISKPIYTTNNKYALVYICKKSWCGIQVYKFENDKWIEYKLLATANVLKTASINK